MYTVYKHSLYYSNVPTIETKELFASTANRLLVGTLISIGDVTQNIAICNKNTLRTVSEKNLLVSRDPFAKS